jgi:hypothetical protein
VRIGIDVDAPVVADEIDAIEWRVVDDGNIIGGVFFIVVSGNV